MTTPREADTALISYVVDSDKPGTDGMSASLINDSVISIFQWLMITVIGQVIDVFGIGTNIINIACFVKQGFSDPINVSLLDGMSASLINDSVISIFQWLMITVIGQVIDVFGIGTNIINIACFVKQGFSDPINVSLLGLAISDIGCLATLIWGSICFTPGFIAADLPFHPIEVTYLTSGIPHTTCTRVTGWITALITLERCLCITAPLKVKTIVTSKRTAVVIICVFIILIASSAPVYTVNWLGEKFSLDRNRTLIGLIFSKDREEVEKFSFTVNNTFIPFSAFVVILICTFVLVIKISKKIKWRQTTTSSKQASIVSSRNKKVAKMVLMISVLFIVCFIPVSITFLAMAMEPKLSVDGKYRNMLTLIAGLGIVLESVNSSVNIFIYYSMSSKYRAALRQILCFDTNDLTK